jgi:glycosyltransferase involved in cell wall biosynthesis
MLVSIFLITYNHEKFIAKAIDSILMQKCNFNFEIIVGEDCSKDSTKEIIFNYQKKYPEIIKPIFNKKNIGPSENAKNVLRACKGDYIAMLEGDDYWTDSLKLKKQIDFLESKPEYSFSCHRYKIKREGEEIFNEDYYPGLFKDNTVGFDIDQELFFKYWLTKTLTAVCRKSCLNFQEFEKYKYFRDLHLFFCLLKSGKGYIHNFYGGVYNIHEEGIGIWNRQNVLKNKLIAFLSLEEIYNNNNKDIHLYKSMVGNLNRVINYLLSNNRKFLATKYILKQFYYTKSLRLFLSKLLLVVGIGRKNT